MTEPAASERAAFASLREDRLDFKFSAEWDDYYARMTPFLMSADASIRDSAVERLCMAVFWAERSNARRANAEFSLARMHWLRGAVEGAAARNPDVRRAFLGYMRYHGGDELFAAPLCAWFADWLAAAADPRLRDELRGALILHAGYSEAASREWIAALDDPSDYVRACAAKMLGEWCGETTAPTAKDLFDLIGDKDIARPGVAGPFWSGHGKALDGEPHPAEWMLRILATRRGAEPDDLPFNGVDFYLHELCYSSPDAVERMLRLGCKELALETALEHRGVVPGMEPILARLGDDPAPDIAAYAIRHLAFYYDVLHPRAGEFQVTRSLDWDARAVVFEIPIANKAHVRVFTVLYPREGARFTDDDAWSLIDKAVDPARRGALAPHEMAFGGPPAPYRLGSELLFKFERARVTLSGDVDAKSWTRAEICV